MRADVTERTTRPCTAFAVVIGTSSTQHLGLHAHASQLFVDTIFKALPGNSNEVLCSGLLKRWIVVVSTPVSCSWFVVV